MRGVFFFLPMTPELQCPDVLLQDMCLIHHLSHHDDSVPPEDLLSVTGAQRGESPCYVKGLFFSL